MAQDLSLFSETHAMVSLKAVVVVIFGGDKYFSVTGRVASAQYLWMPGQHVPTGHLSSTISKLFPNLLQLKASAPSRPLSVNGIMN